MGTLTDARLELADELRLAGLEYVYASTPKLLVYPCVLLSPGSPWFEPRIGKTFSGTLSLEAKCSVSALDNAAALAALEELVELVVNAIPAGIAVSAVDPPEVDDGGSQGVTLTATIQLTAQVKEGS